MKRLLSIIILFSCTIISFAQVSGGMLQRPKVQSSVKSSSTTTKKKPATSARSVKSKQQGSKGKRKKSTKNEELPELTSEDFYQWGEEEFDAKNYSEAKEWYEMAAIDDHAEALYSLGYMYYNGLGVAQDKYKAAQWYFKAANNGHYVATCLLANMFYFGDGIEERHDAAFELFKIIADGGDKEAKFLVAMMYDNGDGTEQNIAMAKKYYDEIYDYLYQNGREAMAQQDGENAEYYFNGVLQAKRTDNTYNLKGLRAACCLGYIYFHGMGDVKEDKTKAFDLFKLASDGGIKEATYYLGVYYLMGYGIVSVKNKTSKNFFKESKYNNKSDVDKVILSSAYD